MTSQPLLDVRELSVDFPASGRSVRVTNNLSFRIYPGEALAIVGESGSGKSVTMRSVLGLVPSPGRVVAGSVVFNGTDLLRLPKQSMRRIRGRGISMVFQDALTAFNPTITIGQQLTEHLRWHKVCNRSEAKRRAIRALTDVGINAPERCMRQYPFQLSGGMRQRAMIAMALVMQPQLLIADEPTTAVDVTLQLQILEILKEMKQRGMAIILITHDLAVARYFCERVIVMYAGQAVEQGGMQDFIDRPAHPYSRGLINSTLEIGESHQPISPIPGTPPNLADLPKGCPFHPRCSLRSQHCIEMNPPLLPLTSNREAACWNIEKGVFNVARSAQSDQDFR